VVERAEAEKERAGEVEAPKCEHSDIGPGAERAGSEDGRGEVALAGDGGQVLARMTGVGWEKG
jgi:hypothetical protein